MNSVDIKQARSSLGILKDPFKSDHLVGMNLFCSKKWSGTGFDYDGTIEFKNGNTKGEQEFTGSSVGDVLKKMEKFIADLDKNHDAK